MSTAIPLDTPLQAPAAPRAVALWLLVCAAMIFAMVVIGGVTRLTESGLSIAEWKPVTGAVPPLTQEAWQEEFARYQQIPEYRARNEGMTLDEYKTIYWWEYIHRLLGRLIGAAFLFPFLYFAATRQVRGGLAMRLGGIFVLGGLQGALGWYMVASGLEDRVDVSPYRLAAHLGLALILYAAILWTALGLLRERPRRRIDGRAAGLAALVFCTIILGSLVAGNDAGMIYNTFPLMDGAFVPRGYLDFDPWWVNLFENAATVQFNHRLAAELTGLCVLLYWLRARRDSDSRYAAAVLLAACIQIALGISTLLLAVPIALGALHQAGAVVLLTATLIAAEHGRDV